MSDIHDGPCSPHFAPLPFAGNANLSTLAAAAATAVPAGMTAEMAAALGHAPGGRCTSWGISFDIGNVVILSDKPVSVEISPIQARWLVFLHTSDIRPLSPGPGGIISPLRGSGQLAEHAADYVVYYAGGAEARVEIRRRRQLGPFDREWGENCFEAVAHHKPYPSRTAGEQLLPDWGWTQARVMPAAVLAVLEADAVLTVERMAEHLLALVRPPAAE